MPSFEIVRDQRSWGAMTYGAGWQSQAGGYGGSCFKHAAASGPNVKAYWVLPVTAPAPGDTFGVYVTWVADPANQTSARYSLTYRLAGVSTQENVFVDQTQAPADVFVGGVGWKKLKDFVHDGDGTADDYTSVGVELFCDGAPSGAVVADAVAANYQP